MNAQLLTRRSLRDGPSLVLHDQVTLPLARLHEACGNARRRFALWVAAKMQGPVFWISPAWQPDRLNPDGMVELVQPGRFTFITPKRPEDILWVMEETLRAGCVPLVVADIPGLPGLTPVRRLHLAAETGAQTRKPPLGLLLTPGDGGAAGVETRWQLDAAHRPGLTGWALARTRARTTPRKSWHATWENDRLQLSPNPPAAMP